MSSRPPSGSMVYWRKKGATEWCFGYVTYVSGANLIRMGLYNGDSQKGPVVSAADIEWREHK